MMKDTFTIKLDLSMMSEQLQCHIARRSEEIHGLVNKTVQAYVTDGTLERVIDAEVRRALDESVKDAIDRYFMLGNGLSHIETQVRAVLDEVIK